MATNKTKLDGMNPAARYALLGTKVDAIITELADLKAIFNAHVHSDVTAGAVDTGISTTLVTAPDPDPLN